MKRIAFSTLGCRLNQYETDVLITDFRRAGYRVVGWKEGADAYVINTCTVTDRSDRKSRALINQAVRASFDDDKGPGNAVVLVTGCYADHETGKLFADDSITYVVDNDRKSHIFHIIDSHFRGEVTDPENLEPDRFAFGDSAGGFHTRSSIKIQDGCDNFCSFCIIPAVRGAAVSRPAEDVLDQARDIIGTGAREIVITGVNIGRYEDAGTSFTDLTEKILEIDGDFRVRVSSVEPDSWEKDFIRLLDHPKLCPHLHLCLQSGSDRTLRAMGRRYTVADYLSFVDAARRKNPDFNITTDIMVGFPGETEADFQETRDVVMRVGFGHIHTFPFSVREGTGAATMEKQVPYRVKSDRAAAIRSMSEEQKIAYRRGLVGRHQTMLIEKVEKGIASGYGELYVPVEVVVPPGGAAEPNTFARVVLESLEQGKDPVFRGVWEGGDAGALPTRPSGPL